MSELHLDAPGESCAVESENRDTLVWYSRSVSVVCLRIVRGALEISVTLVSCILFVCIESLQSSLDTALQLNGQGLRLSVSLRAQMAGGVMPAINACSCCGARLFQSSSVWKQMLSLSLRLKYYCRTAKMPLRQSSPPSRLRGNPSSSLPQRSSSSNALV